MVIEQSFIETDGKSVLQLVYLYVKVTVNDLVSAYFLTFMWVRDGYKYVLKRKVIIAHYVLQEEITNKIDNILLDQM